MRNRSSNKSGFKAFIWLLILLAAIFFGLKWFWHSLNSPVDPNGQAVLFTVNKGEGTSSIADSLESQHLIKNALVFKINLKLSDKVGTIEAGDFQLSAAMSTDQIISTLSKGSNEDVTVTLLEGWRDEEMAGKLSESLGIKTSDFMKEAKQGYMFPDTYQFHKNATVETVIQTLRQNFDSKYSLDLQNKVSRLGLSPAQGVILASIVEREGRSPEVKQKIASILLKRFNMGMALDADATVQYVLGYQTSEKSWWKRALTLNDLKVDSPYNTYTNPGLPPAPICNPGLVSLQAVANADPSVSYLYYYIDSKGIPYYEKTLDEHNADVAQHP